MSPTEHRASLPLIAVCCAFALLPSLAHADNLSFTVDSSQSYLTLNIPNFSYFGNNINVTGQNRTNGAPISTAWSASTTTGNTAFISGTFATTIGGSLTGKTLTSIQFISGASNLSALSSGNYRPNPAAYNSIVSAYNNNSSTPGNYAFTEHTLLGNQALVSFDNVTYDINSGNLPGSWTVGSGVINLYPWIDLNFGILDSMMSVQGLSVFLVGQYIPNYSGHVSNVAANDAYPRDGTYTFNGPDTNLNIKIPLSIPISIDMGGGTLLNGTATGQIVANSAVPEPSTMALAALAGVSIVAVWRRRRR